MLNGPIYSKIILFAIPVALSSILQQLFNSADSIFADRMISSEALAAVGGVTPIISLFVALLTGLAIGANVAIAVIGVACTLSGVLALGIFTADAAALAFGVIRLWHVEIFGFMPCLYEIPAGAMRGMGWSLLPTVIVIVGSCLLRIAYVIFVFPFVASFENLLLIYPFTWVVTAIAMGILFFIARKRSYAKIAASQTSAEPRPR